MGRSESECLVETKRRLFEVLVNSLTFAKRAKANADFSNTNGQILIKFHGKVASAAQFSIHGQSIISLHAQNIQGEHNHSNLMGILNVMRLQKQH